MQRKTVFVLLFILTGALLVGCAPVPYVQTDLDYWPPEAKYTVYGRVVNFMHQPVPDCRVYLQRRVADPTDGTQAAPARAKTAEMDAEFLVATTSRSGDYSFVFEPWKAYDVWVYFDALDKGYSPQRIQLNSYLRSLIGRGIGKSPIYVDVILEPMQQ